MANWFASLFFAALALGLACMAGTELGLGVGVWLTAGLILWLSAGLLFSGPGQFADDVTEIPEKMSVPVNNAAATPTDDHAVNEQSLMPQSLNSPNSSALRKSPSTNYKPN